MRIFFKDKLPDHPVTLIKRAGYGEHRDSHSSETSYTHRMGPEFYPRFHIYIEEGSNGVTFNLHLDQKKPSYGGGTHAHSGEYDGHTVEREAERIKQFIANYAPQVLEEPKKKSFWQSLFGKKDDFDSIN